MATTYWKPVRISLLAVTLAGVLLVTGKLTFYPSTGNSFATKFEFPESVPLADWKLQKSAPLKISDTSEVKAARKYEYQKSNIALEIEMRYVVGTIGDVESMMKGHTILKSSPGKLTLANTQGAGFHGILLLQNRLYLSSCINPRGSPTVTSQQFRYNRNTRDWQPNRILFWLLGRGNIQDRRCLWTQMSVPLDKTTPENAQKLLENAWVSWYGWWQPRFPEP
ncbi:MAG: cyanoexosortase A system-associated protein [Microcoleus sp. PH2017_10_PVI_O_A]|uniref:cyanoexosortase A system-associated protein n=1 Tax=unclassified Microcoleus TaxID=2642155 RepID=UPI001D95530F|nr:MULTISPECIES: cyanoexosortase A system-associated protein [unclassified Microcoleus]TAE83721.1 MAG: cyanoexosortase A system-associated protein [Oscillatoriales cyanobacterium]MCC3409311.1 cyanoexosortase A system-associated protein [Microcoleus sp. PH2017_10_PVI_O_A]MCC3463556.1 cyanoexosortase A system-associated protein [Microcoleus sp. PH2017_11_PCY_U_A]MCC3481890.1 cyanoexosortase A system-associated protein [Microcoleus sp. PH2017_12_PCY_D_A]MCC3562865.1 cyanoexosortase A system-assoc